MVCRVFQKSAGIKKYPTNQSRAANPYNLEIGPSVVPSPMMQLGDHQFPYGRNYMTSAELAEISRVLRTGSSGGGGSSNGTINVPIQPQFNYPNLAGGGGGGGFTISGLNLNLGAPATQPMLRPMPPPQLHHQGPPAMNPHQQDVMSNGANNNSLGPDHQAGYGAIDMNNNNANGNGNRFMNMEHCVDLDTYWPPY